MTDKLEPVASKQELNKIAKALQDLWRIVKPSPCPSSYDAIWREYAAEIRRVTLSSATAALAEKDARIAELEREREAADHKLVDRYRDPKTGTFSFPSDVAAIVRKLDAAEAEATRLRGLLEEAGKVVEPFAYIAGQAWADEDGWMPAARRNDRIVEWFGPLDFRAARSLYDRIKEEGK